MTYVWSFGVIAQYQDAFIAGLGTTLLLSAVSLVLATLIGTSLAVSTWLSHAKWVRWTVRAVIEVFRNIPIIVILVWLFYALPLVTGVKLPAFGTAVLGLSLAEGAFIAEILRAGMDAIPKGQLEAARLLGLTPLQTLQHVVLPQAFLRNLPALFGEYAWTIKNSTLAVIIGVNELLHQATTAASLSYRPVELYTFVGIAFLVIILPLSYLSKRLEFHNFIVKTKQKI